jgi:hypothetical protein
MKALIDLRSRRITGEYFLVFLGFQTFAFFFTLNRKVFEKVSAELGFVVPSNLIIFSLSILGLILSYRVNKQIKMLNDKVIILAQRIAIRDFHDANDK